MHVGPSASVPSEAPGEIMTYVTMFASRFVGLCLAIGAAAVHGETLPLVAPSAGQAETAATGNVDPLKLTPVNVHLSEAMIASLGDGTTEVRVTGATPMISVSSTGQLRPASMRILSFSVFSATPTDHVRLEYETSDGKNHVSELAGLSQTEGFADYTADLGDVEDWPKAVKILRLGFSSSPGRVIRLRNIVVRTRTERERTAFEQREKRKQQDDKLDADLQHYLEKSFPDRIEIINGTEKTLVIRGSVTGTDGVFLAEVPSWEDLTQLKTFDDLTPVKATDGRFSLEVTRYRTMPDHIYDRLLSKWVLVHKEGAGYTELSHAHFADEVKAKWNLPDEVPRSKKGLGGFNSGGPVGDLDDLGITSVTVNIFLSFLRTDAAPDRIPFRYGGRQYYADEGEISKYDKTLQYAAAHRQVVSAILLVPKAAAKKEGPDAALLALPSADPAGIYAMPNFSSAEGVQAYAAVLNFLAERYSRPDRQFGRIHHWIMHNEVDAGWVWTNAGSISELTFMDLYIKSMRTMYLIARQYNPHARVYISLTHYWNQTVDPHFYLPHRMLDELVQFSKEEGDFEWSIAYHPYPNSLFKPRTWEDTMTTFDLNTPLITPRNIEVLDAWTRQPQTFYRGQKPRSIFLSEQGFNSIDYSEKSLAEQAAGMAYVWKKIERLDSIEAYQYHNWIDNRGEGGLRIGLRKFPDEAGDPLGRKPIWYLLQKLGTPQEDAACEPYLKIVGVSSWDEVRHTGPITGLPLPTTLRNLQSDQWTATDALGRTLPGLTEAGPPRPARFVGMFYFLTANQTAGTGPRDATRTLASGLDSTKWPLGTYYWGEPEVGYYLSSEDWVIRHHAAMLSDAGVDVIVFDATNDVTHKPEYMAVLRVFAEMRTQGEPTPQVAFLASRRSLNLLWDELYSKGVYRDLWFQWKGKPLLMIGQQRGMPAANDLPPRYNDFFAVRESWAWDSLPWYRDGHDQWPWVAHTPQPFGWHEGPDRPEQVPVAVAEHPLSGIGRSFHNGKEPALDAQDRTAVTDQGLFFQEQWDRALALDPEFIFVTGWNEWTAGSMTMGADVSKDLARWDFYPGASLGRSGHPVHPGDVYFIDQYNQEFSRDIEPMRGGHTDNFYYQLAANIRRYKGVHLPEPVSLPRTIDLHGSFSQWTSVTPEFLDHAFDTLHRRSTGSSGAGPYIDATGRNDILSAKVARDATDVYFLVKTRDPITSPRGPHWMNLLVRTGSAPAFNLVINAKVMNARTTTAREIDDTKVSAPIRLAMRVDANEMMVAVPRSLLHQQPGQTRLDFQWVDNNDQLGDDPNGSALHGDSAPDRRAHFHYEAVDPASW